MLSIAFGVGRIGQFLNDLIVENDRIYPNLTVGGLFFAARVGTGYAPVALAARRAPPIHTILHIRIFKLIFDPPPPLRFSREYGIHSICKTPPLLFGSYTDGKYSAKSC